MHGAVSPSRVEELVQLLKGLSGRPPATFKNHEIVLRGQRQGAPPIELKIQRPLKVNPDDPEPPKRWKVRHESLPIRGQAAEQLPAAVRGVSEACCYDTNPVDFWASLGFKMDYQAVHSGSLFAVWQGQHQIFVRVMSINKMKTADPNKDDGSVTPEWVLVEVFLTVTTDTVSQMEGLYTEACKAIGDLAKKLKDFVSLQKPAAR